MGDPMTFEARLADAYERYLSGAPTDVDPVEVAAAIRAARPRRRIAPWQPTAGRPRWLTVAIATLLILALLGATAFLVGRFLERPHVPWAYRNQIVAAEDLPAPQAFAQLVPLTDGRVLMLDGCTYGPATGMTFDPATGIAHRLAPLVSASALCISDAALLADGRVMIVGDQRPGTTPSVAVAELFDPSAGTFKAIGPMIHPRSEASLVPLADGRVLVIGGVDPTLGSWGPEDTFPDIEAYDPATNTFADATRLPHAEGFGGSTWLLPDGRAVVFVQITRPDGSGGTALETLDTLTNTWTELDPSNLASPGGVRLPLNATFESLGDGRVLIVGEATSEDGGVLPGVSVVWDPATDAFSPTRAAPWSYSSALRLDDGRLLLLGLYSLESGRPEGPWAATFDLETGEAKVIDGQTACYPGVVRLPDGRVAFIGGREDCQIHNPEAGGELAPAVPTVQIFQ